MGLSNFPNPPDGLLPMIIVSTVFLVALLKNTARSLLQPNVPEPPDLEEEVPISTAEVNSTDQLRRVTVMRFKSLCRNRNSSGGGGSGSSSGGDSSDPTLERITTECCVCLSGFEAEEEVSELMSCKHFFHKGCLQKWFDNRRNSSSPCPLCRSLL